MSKIFKECTIDDFLVLKSEYGKISKHQDKTYKLFEVLMDEHKYEWIFDKSQKYPFRTKWLYTFEREYNENIKNSAE